MSERTDLMKSQQLAEFRVDTSGTQVRNPRFLLPGQPCADTGTLGAGASQVPARQTAGKFPSFSAIKIINLGFFFPE